MTTDTLIERLARELQPVRPLPRPRLRTLTWLCGAAIYLVLIAAPLTSSADVDANTSRGIWFFLPQLLSLLTAVIAAAAAFASVIPGYSRRGWIGAAVAVASWAVSLVIGARGQWSLPPDPTITSEWVCVALIVGIGAPLLWVMARMLQRGVVFNAPLTAALSALAVVSLVNVGACFTHPHTNNALTFVWHGTLLLAVVALALILGPRLLRPR